MDSWIVVLLVYLLVMAGLVWWGFSHDTRRRIMRRMTVEIENLKVSIGEVFLPAIQRATKAFDELSALYGKDTRTP